MLSVWIPIVISILAFIVLVYLVIRKLPYLRALDIRSLPQIKMKELKNNLMAERLQRHTGNVFKKVFSVLKPVVFVFKLVSSTVVKKLTSLEDHYQQLKKESAGAHALDEDTAKKLIQEARQFMKEEQYGKAEKNLIEVLSHQTKNIEAYEELGELYMLTKSFDQAEETFNFILKLSPDDASVMTNLGELELMRDKPVKALRHFAKAIKKRPNNPKYLDFYIEAGIRAGKSDNAKKGLDKLKEVNPENQKLPEFAERIIKMENKAKED